MAYFVYLIGSTKNSKVKTYVGYTNNLKRRIHLHNLGRAAKSTRGRKWKVCYFKKYKSRNEAMSKEYFLKRNYPKRKIIISKFLATNRL